MKNTTILSTLFALCFWACSKTSPSEPNPLLWSQTLKSSIESVQLSGQWLFVSQELFATNTGTTVNYHKPFRSFDKSTGQTGLELPGVDNFYVHENQAALFYSPSKIEIFDLDTRTVKATLATSPSILVSDPFGGSHYEEPFFTGAGHFLFYAAGPQFHLAAYDLQSGQMAPIAPDSFPAIFSLAAWEEPNGHVLYLKRHFGAPFSPNESAQLYDQTTGQLLASSNNDLGYFFSGQQAGELFFGSNASKLAAIEKNGFQVRWEIAKKGNVQIEGDMVIQTNGTAADSIFGYRASDGGLVWAVAKQQNFAIEAAGDGLVLLSHYTGGREVVGINVQTGAEAFRLKTAFIQRIWAVSDGLFWASAGNELACYKYR